MGRLIVPKRQEPAPKGANVIHVTERHQFGKCRRLWDFESRQRIKPKLQELGGRSFGTAMHAALRKYYDKQIDGYGLIVAREAALEKLVELEDMFPTDEDYQLAHNMLRGYLKVATQFDNGYKPVAVEENLWARIPDTDIWLTGSIDLILQDYRGNWIVDHKNYKPRSVPTAQDMDWDDQMTVYMWLCRENGLLIEGSWYNILVKDNPTKPRILKNGQMSRDKGISTTKEVYTQALIEAGLNVEDYRDHIDSIEDKILYVRHPVNRTKQTIINYGQYIRDQALDMFDNPRIYPEQNFSCGMCDYGMLCRTITAGGNVENTMQELYMVKDEDER